MSLDTALKYIDVMFTDKNYLDKDAYGAIVLEFIGGEPFLEVELIDQILDAFFTKMINEDNHLAVRWVASFSTNGTLYRTEKVQEFINKWQGFISIGVTVDGNKELHDACRVFHNGEGSYDLAIDAALDLTERGFNVGSKITIAPENVDKLFVAIKHFIELGFKDIHANCVFEEGWTYDHAKIYYQELKNIADYILDNDLVPKIAFVIFRENNFRPLDPSEDRNWCGGTGAMLSCDPDGVLLPCTRYAKSSLGTDVPEYQIGNVNDGLMTNEVEIARVEELKTITRHSQSTDECINCPIAAGCAWCSAYNYQTFGTANKRATFICPMHKAESLAYVYFWNSYYRIFNMSDRVEVYCPKDWALQIIDEDEYNMLLQLSTNIDHNVAEPKDFSENIIQANTLVKEGTEANYLNEKAETGFFAKVKEALKKLLEKVKGLFKALL